MSTPDFAEIRSSALLSMPNIAIAKGRYVVGALALGGSLFVLGHCDPASAQVAKTSTKQSSKAAPRNTVHVSAPARGASYTVRSGDSLSSIAQATKTSVGQLASLNQIANPNRIKPGQVLMLPTGAKATGAPAPKPAAGGKPIKAASSNGSSTTGKPSPGQPLPDAIRGTSRAKLNSTFDKAAATYGVPAELLKSIAYQESGWNNDKVSSVGARGIGQLMPDTSKFINQALLSKPQNPAIAEQNINMSAAYLRFLLNQTKGNETKAVGAYYQGLRAVNERGMFQDTLVYISNVQAIRARWF